MVFLEDVLRANEGKVHENSCYEQLKDVRDGGRRAVHDRFNGVPLVSKKCLMENHYAYLCTPCMIPRNKRSLEAVLFLY